MLSFVLLAVPYLRTSTITRHKLLHNALSGLCILPILLFNINQNVHNERICPVGWNELLVCKYERVEGSLSVRKLDYGLASIRELPEEIVHGTVQ